MIDMSFVTNNRKTMFGIASIIICAILLYIKPFYVEWYMLLLIIPAIGLIIPNDSIKNSHILGIITFLIVIFILYVSINGFLNTYPIMSNLYLTNQISHVPTASEISHCANTYLLIIAYSIYNIICGVMYFIPTTIKKPY